MPLTSADRRLLILIGVANVAFAVGSILFASMVVLFVPAAFPYIFPYLDWAVGVPLIAGGAILTLLREW